MENRIEKIENELDAIKKRNSRVEADKAWETSLTRKALIALLTYLVICSLFVVMNVSDPYFSALIPAI